VIVIVPEAAATVYVTLQVLVSFEPVAGARVQVEPLKDPPAPPSLQATVPLGLVFLPALESATLTVRVKVLPDFTFAEFGDSVVVVVLLVTVIEKGLLTLTVWLLSPL